MVSRVGRSGVKGIAMDERVLRDVIEDVRQGRLSRRAFTRQMLGLGLTAPLAAQMLASSGVAVAAEKPVYKPTKRGGGGALKVLWWQGPTLLNPHFAVGTKDQDGSRIFYEPLAGWNADGDLVPVLAAEIPTLDNGGLGEDGKSVTWKLKQGVKWHDGKPFTADDCVFNWEYAADPATAAVTIGTYKDVKVVKVDDHTIRVEFAKPTPFWADAFVGTRGMIIPKHLFEPIQGRQIARGADQPGAGRHRPLSVRGLQARRPGAGQDQPELPHGRTGRYFDSIEMKGGGDAVSAARAVLQTGEFDFAWNMQVEDEILKRLETGGKGRVVIFAGGNIEHIQLNNTDPWKEVDGERSSIKTKHPFLTDPAVREALNLLVDRASVQQVHLWPHRHRHRQLRQRTRRSSFRRIRNFEFNVEKATKLLDDAGWKPGSDGVREKNGSQAEGGLPDLDQRAAPEDPGDRQAGLPEGRHRHRDQVGHGFGVLLVGRRQPGHLYALLLRPADVHDDDDRAGPGACSCGSSCRGGRQQGEQVAGPQHHALAEQGVRRAAPSARRARSTRSSARHCFITMNDLADQRTSWSSRSWRARAWPPWQTTLHAPLSGWDNNTWALQDWYRDA